MKFPRIAATVPSPVAVYALLSLLDFGFSLIAFQLGYLEGNPWLAFSKEHGLFEVMKIGTTIVIVLIGMWLWKLKVVRLIVAVANCLMFGLFFVHLFSLIKYLAFR